MEKQQWEYCLVRLSNHELYFLTSEGPKKHKIQGGYDGCLTTIAQLGREGWEMTAATDFIVWFKRAMT